MTVSGRICFNISAFIFSVLFIYAEISQEHFSVCVTVDLLCHGAKDYPVVFFFFNVTVLCVSVARIRDGAGGRVIALSAEITLLEAGAFFFFFWHIIY